MQKQILIIEDEIIIAKDIANMLKNNGYENSKIITNSDEAIKFLKTNTPHLIICDIYLKSKTTGIQIIEQLNNNIKIPVIYVSAYSDNETLTKAFASKPASYITKPFTENQLITAVKFAQNLVDIKKNVIPNNITDSELEIIFLLTKGLSTKEIADIKCRSYETINNHKRNIFKKLEVNKTTQLVSKARELGIV